MKRSFSLLAAAALLLCCTACGGEKVSRKDFIPDMFKSYFEGAPAASSITLDLNDYVEKNGLIVDFSVSSDDEEVAVPSVEGDALTVQLVGEGTAQVTVDVLSNGKSAMNFTFCVTAERYDKIACVGDSLTYGHTWHNESYPVYLQELFGEGVEVQNFGVNGAALTNRSDPSFKLKYDTLEEYRQSLAFSPDIVLVMLGSNDGYAWQGSEATYAAEYEKLVNAYRENGAKEVCVMSAPPTLENNAFNIYNAVLEESVYPAQRLFAQEMELPFIDVRTAVEGKTGGYESLYRPGDGVHFSVEGAKFVAQCVFNALSRL